MEKKLTPELLEKLRGYGLSKGEVEFTLQIEDVEETISKKQAFIDKARIKASKEWEEKFGEALKETENVELFGFKSDYLKVAEEQAEEKWDNKVFYIDEEFWPTFKLKVPTNAEYKQIRDAYINSKGTTNDLIYKVIKLSVVGWENLYDTVNTGELIPYEKEQVKHLSEKLQQHIFVHLSKITGII